jgi:molybdate transport system permease protein
MELPDDMLPTLFLTFRLAALTTALLLAAGVPLAYWIAHSESRLRPVAETLVSMPLVLPPTVLGFYLILAFNPAGSLGAWLESFLNVRLVFSFAGLLVASVIYSLPFMVQPLLAGFRGLSPSLREASATLGKSAAQTLFRVLLPAMKPALLSGIVLSFAHTIGEFGVVLMIGGNIPGVTRVASIAIYDEVESLRYGAANSYALVLIGVMFCLLLPLYWKRSAARGPSPRRGER